MHSDDTVLLSLQLYTYVMLQVDFSLITDQTDKMFAIKEQDQQVKHCDIYIRICAYAFVQIVY